MRRSGARALAAVCALAAAGAAVGAGAWTATPPAAHLALRVEQRVAATDARPVRLGDVSPFLVRALVATEDERFYRHHGIDLIGLARALPYDLVHASLAQGASTLTEQVAKLLYLGGDDHAPWRKLEDMALAVKLESRYSKAQILTAYLNTAYFGAGATGIAAASRRYFGRPPRRLTLAQATLLAGLPQAPSAYDPFTHPAAARARQTAVLRSLVRTGSLAAPAAARLLARPLRLRGGSVLPPVRSVATAPGPALAWPGAAAGLALALLAAVALGVGHLLRRRRLAGHAAALVAVLLLLLGLAAVARSFRTL